MSRISNNLTAANICDEHSVGPSIRPLCTKCCFTMTNTIQVCSNFDRAGVFIINIHPDEIPVHSVSFVGFVGAGSGGGT